MKKNLLLIITAFLTYVSYGQITVTNAVFPQVGDVYYTSGEGPNQNVVITAAGGNQTWVFDQFIPTSADTSEIIDASQGTVAADYPSADIVIPGQGGEGYAKNSGNQLELIGVYGGIGFGGGGFSIPLSPSSVILNTPLTFNSTFNDVNSSNVAFDPQDFPFLQTLLDSILPPFVTVDSIRNIQTIDRTDLIDAWGTLTTNHGTFDVLRMRQYSITDRAIEFKIPVLGWVDPSTFGVAIPFAGLDTTLSYQFINDVEKVSIMTVNVDDITGDIQSVRYKIDPSEIVTGVEDEISNGSFINAYPNPAVNNVDIEISLKNSGNYTINIYNILGVKLLSEDLYVNRHAIANLEIGKLTKGNYLYSLSTDTGEILFTKRLSVVRP